MKFTTGQEKAIYKIGEWLGDRSFTDRNKMQLLDGKSGSGKTTIIPFIINSRKRQVDVYVVAPTNKAVSVIKQKLAGFKITAKYTTLHSLIYGQPDKNGVWTPKTENISDALVIVDECSMLTKTLYDDLNQKFKASHILFIGDQFQLEPIGDSADLYLPRTGLTSTMLVLDEVCRYGDGILDTANYIRDFNIATVKLNRTVGVRDLQTALKAMSILLHQGTDCILLTATNKNRVTYNTLFRKILSKPTSIFNDYLIAVNNSNVYSNGEVFLCKEPTFVNTKVVEWGNTRHEIHIYQEDDTRILFIPDLTQASLHLREIWQNIPKGDYIDLCGAENVHVATGITKNVVVATWGYAISCHKSQGSQWRYVFVDFDYCASTWSAPRWLYTAITRASDGVCIIPSPNIKLQET